MNRGSRESALMQAVRCLRREAINLKNCGEGGSSSRLMAMAADLDAKAMGLLREAIEAREVRI